MPNGWEFCAIKQSLRVINTTQLEGAGSLSKEIPWQIPSGNSNDLGISCARIFLL